jgi:hypothetical protein
LNFKFESIFVIFDETVGTDFGSHTDILFLGRDSVERTMGDGEILGPRLDQRNTHVMRVLDVWNVEMRLFFPHDCAFFKFDISIYYLLILFRSSAPLF